MQKTAKLDYKELMHEDLVGSLYLYLYLYLYLKGVSWRNER